jgi:RNA polymerase sigma-32 factor
MTARMGSEDVSLDAPVRGDEDDARQTRLDRYADREPGADEALGNEELKRMFREKLDAFAASLTDEKERYIFEHRLLPRDGEEPLTLQQIGDRFHLTRERARQIEAKMVKKLREQIQDEIPDFEFMTPPE